MKTPVFTPVIASASEAIHTATNPEMDRFRLRPLGYGGQVVANAPRNDG